MRTSLLAGLLALAACSGEPRRQPIASLDARFEPLRAAFDADAGHVRILAILSPS